MRICFFTIFFLLSLFHIHCESLYLRNNLQKAQPGDYLIISANSTDTLFHIYDKKDSILTIEEIAVPSIKKPKTSWKEWVEQGAPENNSWVMYDIDTHSGKMLSYYSFTKKGWFEIAEADNLLSKLMNLSFSKIPLASRRHLGLKPAAVADPKRIWQPVLVVEGKMIQGVFFDAWRTQWPQDNSELSGKQIEIYLPQENERYPSYFPYWLQISGTVGKAKIRVIDSGSHLKSPKGPTHKESL